MGFFSAESLHFKNDAAHQIALLFEFACRFFLRFLNLAQFAREIEDEANCVVDFFPHDSMRRQTRQTRFDSFKIDASFAAGGVHASA